MRNWGRTLVVVGMLTLPVCGVFACGKDAQPRIDDVTGGEGGEMGVSSGGSSDMTASGGEQASYDAFDAFREMQASLRKSPDHLIARSQALVEERNAEGLFELVRDDIAAIPGLGGFYGAGTARRFGSRATLRGGMGTLRERADLLQELLTEAGFEAEVYVGKPEADFVIEELLARPTQRMFSPQMTDSERRLWHSTLPPLTSDFQVSALDPDGESVNQLLELLEQTGINADGAIPLDFDVNELPFVRLEVEGEKVDLNPNFPQAKWGETHATDSEPAPPPGPLETFFVRLGIARSSAPNEEIPLVEKMFSVDELVGRTVTASFPTPHTLLEAMRTEAKDAQTFIPSLQVKGHDLSDAAGQALSAVGEPFTRGGELVQLEDTGNLIGDERVALPPSDPALLSSVQSISLEVDESAFPEVSVLVSLRDENGALVNGLAADAFSVEESGKNIPAVLRRSELPPPKVALLFDRSSSLPSEFLDEAAATGHEIATSLFAAVPGLSIQIVGMDFNGPAVAGGFATNIEDVDSQLAMLSGAASELWTNLEAIATSDADIIVLISDFVADDVPNPEIERAIAAGAPVLAVAVGEADSEVANRVAELSGGSRFDGLNATGVANRSAEFAAELSTYSYRIVYRADAESFQEREIHVQVDGGRVLGMATYLVPESPAPLPAISGVFVTIATAGREVRRLVAGSMEPNASGASLAEADAMLFGRVILGVEAGPPSLAVKLDEHIGERLKFEKLVDATLAHDQTKAIRALQSSRTRTPANLRFAFSAGPDEAEGPATYPEGVSTALYVERPIWNYGVRRSLDWLPLAPRRTALRDAQEAFARTTRRTAYLAAIEARRFSESTLELVADEALGVYDAISIDTSLGPEWYAPVQSYGARQLVAPTSGSPLAFFAVDPETGDLIGGLPDGTGGAVTDDIERTLAQIDTILDLAERAGELGGFNGIQVWTALERTKAQLVGSATILFGEGGLEPSIPGAVADALEDAAEEGITDEIPGWNDVFGPVGDLGDLYDGVEAFTGNEMPDIGPPMF